MEITTYIWAWVFYLLSATGLIMIFWRITRGVRWRRTRRTSRALVAVLLLTPINIVEGESWLAPAYLVGAYDWVLGQNERALEAGMYLAWAFAILITVILLESVLRRLLGMERE